MKISTMISYTPKTLTDVILPSANAKLTMTALLTGAIQIPSDGTNGILLYGPAGTGKTTSANLLPVELEKLHTSSPLRSKRFIDCKHPDNGVDLISSLESTAKSFSFNDSEIHYFVIDEVDNLTSQAMKNLKNVMNIPQTIFIMTTNHLEKISTPVQSRSIKISFEPETPDVWLPLAQKILREEQVSIVNDQRLLEIISLSNNNGRELIPNMRMLVAKFKREIVSSQLGAAKPR